MAIRIKQFHRQARNESRKKKEKFRVPIGQALQKLERRLRELDSSQRITEEDLAVTINPLN